MDIILTEMGKEEEENPLVKAWGKNGITAKRVLGYEERKNCRL